jgi:protein SCO1
VSQSARGLERYRLRGDPASPASSGTRDALRTPSASAGALPGGSCSGVSPTPAWSHTLCAVARARPHGRSSPGRASALLAGAVFLLALATTAITGCGGGSGGAAAVGTSSHSGFDGGLLPAGLKPHGFTLTDQYGRRVSLSHWHGQVVILAFLYSSSKATAPLIAQQVRGALDELHPAVPAIAISVDPRADTSTRVRTFLRANGLSGRLEYLTGSPAQLRGVWRAYHVVPAAAGEGAYERGAFVLILDRNGAERVEFSLEELTPEALAHDVRRLEASSSAS